MNSQMRAVGYEMATGDTWKWDGLVRLYGRW